MLRRSFLTQVALAWRQDRIEQAFRVMDDACRKAEVAEASLLVRQNGKQAWHGWGKTRTADRVFLLASITKPMTATAVMVLAGRGRLRLDDKVNKHIPEFRGGDRDLVTVKHLLTHTSGLPDMLPDNEALRRKHAPLSGFVAGACKVPLLFQPGTQCRYQSMGILLAAEIAERVTKMRFRDFLAKEVFAPLGMKHTSLGMGGRKIAELAWSQVTGNDDWNWNSPYWRDFGAPWGGAHAPATDVARFLEYFLNPDARVLKPDTARAMVANQNAGLNEPWGIGWMVKAGRFGKACSDRTFGHWGSTGTLAWADPKTGTSFVLLTTKPASDSRDVVLAPVADAVAEAVA